MAPLLLHSQARHRPLLLPPLAFLMLGALALPATFLEASLNCTHVAEVTEGPYWVEENIEASNLRLNVSLGLPLNLTVRIVNGTLSALAGTCVPIASARIDIWHARYDGLYSDVDEDWTTGQTWLRGYQHTNTTGYATFTTIFPGWYVSRTIHIHMRVRIYDKNTTTYEETTQLYFEDTITQAICANVYPYFARGFSTRDTFNTNDALFDSSNIITLEGDYNDINGYSGIVELSLPLTQFRMVNDIGERVKSGDGHNQGPSLYNEKLW